MFLTTFVFGLCVLTADQPAATTEKAPEVSEGAAFPSFEALDDRGQTWKSADHVGKKVIVLYFYPGDFTGGCIRQAQAFREGLVNLEALDIEVVGVSGDSVETHRLFKESHGLKHTLLADPDGAMAKQLGLPVQKGSRVRTRGLDGKPLMDEKGKSIILERKVTLPRWTLIVGQDGKVISKRTDVNPATDAEEVGKIVAGLAR
jgi:peroxiredoxin Q/BCP